MTYPHGFEHLNIFFIFVVTVTGHSTRAAICDVTGCFCPGVPDVLTFTCQCIKISTKFYFLEATAFPYLPTPVRAIRFYIPSLMATSVTAAIPARYLLQCNA